MVRVEPLPAAATVVVVAHHLIGGRGRGRGRVRGRGRSRGRARGKARARV